MLEGRTSLHVSPEPFFPVVTFLAIPEVRGAIASAPLSFEKSLQRWLTREFCCSLTLRSWRAIGFLRPVVGSEGLPQFPTHTPAQGAGRDFLLGMISLQRSRGLCSAATCPFAPTYSQQERFSPCPGVAKFALVHITK